MGTVWLARDTRDEQLVALKTVNQLEPKLLSRFRREIRTLRRLAHPGIVAFGDEGTTDQGRPWYTMPLLRGNTLLTHIQRSEWELRGFIANDEAVPSTVTTPEHLSQDHWISKLEQLWVTGTLEAEAISRIPSTMAITSPAPIISAYEAHETTTPDDTTRPRQWPLGPYHQRILSWLGKLSMTLAYLHGEGVVHCDLKPENIFITADDQVILLDFGISEHFGARVEPDSLEGAGQQAGTTHYISPEQLRGGWVDARTDLYSLGCILYQVLAGKIPFDSPEVATILHHHLYTAPPLLTRYIKELPPSLEIGVARLLAKQPHHRLGHPQLVTELLRQAKVTLSPWEDAPTPRHFLYRPAFVGREQLMLELDEHLEDSAQGVGRALLLGGESGVGKSRLAAELLSRARAKDMLILHGQGQWIEHHHHLAAAEPLHVLRPMWRHIADVCQQEGPEFTQRILGERGKLIEPYMPFLADLAGQRALPHPEELPPEQSRNRLFAAIIQSLELFCAHTPTLIILDDLHWADRLSLAFIEHLLLSTLKSKPWFIFGLYRTEDMSYQLAGLLQRPGVGCLRLDRLAQEDIQSVISQMLGHPAPPELLVNFVHTQTEGNPFYVAEYLRLALDELLLKMDDHGVWELRPVHERMHIEQLHTPRAVQDLITDRLERLPEAALDLAQAAAILGKQCTKEALLHTSQIQLEPMISWLELLERREILMMDEDEHIQFAHDKIREGAYLSTPPALKQALHGRAAKFFATRKNNPAGMLGHHQAQAGWVGLAAKSHLRDAQRALKDSAHGQAGRLLERALELGATLDPEQLLTALELAEHTWLNTGEPRAAHEHLQRLDQLAKALDLPLLRAKAQTLLGELYLQRRQYKQAERALNEASSRYERFASAKGQADVMLSLSRLATQQQRFDDARAFAESAHTIYRRHKHLRGQARALQLLAELCSQQLRLRESLSNYELAMELYERLKDPFHQADTMTQMSRVLYELGHSKQAANCAARGLKLTRKIGHLEHEAYCLMLLGATSIERNHLPAACKYLEQAIEHLLQRDDLTTLVRARALQCRAHRLLGDLPMAQLALDRAEHLCPPHLPQLQHERTLLLIERAWLRMLNQNSPELAIRALELHARAHPLPSPSSLARAMEQHKKELTQLQANAAP